MHLIVYSPALTVFIMSCLGEGRHVCIYEVISWVPTNPFCPETVPTGFVVPAVLPLEHLSVRVCPALEGKLIVPRWHSWGFSSAGELGGSTHSSSLIEGAPAVKETDKNIVDMLWDR